MPNELIEQGRDPRVTEAIGMLKECLLLFAKDHALDRFDWGKSFLRAQDIAELNYLPGKIQAMIAKLEKHRAY